MKPPACCCVIAALCMIGMASAEGQTAAAPAQQSVLDLLAGSGQCTVFMAALREVGLGETLRGRGPFTLFAPTDEAFDRIPKAKLDALLKDRDQLRSVIFYHVAAGRFSSQEVLAKRTVKTFEGRLLRAAMKGKRIGVENGIIVKPDLLAPNGIVHIIDLVLIPPAPDNYR